MAGEFSPYGIVGGVVDRLFGVQDRRQQQDFAMQQQAANIAAQREFAQQGIRWKVEDAKAAGIHPLYALGASTHSFSPVSISSPDTPATNFAALGQDLSRSIQAGRTGEERADAFTKTAQALQLENSGLQNELLRTQIAKLRGQVGPPVPTVSPKVDGVDMKTVEPHLMGGTPYATQGGTSQASHIEDQYGEVADYVGGFNWLRDVGIPYMFPGLIESLQRGKLRKTGSRFVSKRYRD